MDGKEVVSLPRWSLYPGTDRDIIRRFPSFPIQNGPYYRLRGCCYDLQGRIYYLYGALRRADLRGLYHQVRPEDPYFVNTGNYKTAPRPPSWATTTPPASSRTSPTGWTASSARLQGHPPGRLRRRLPVPQLWAGSPYCFNRKEAKDHGEGGSMVGYKPRTGTTWPSWRT